MTGLLIALVVLKSLSLLIQIAQYGQAQQRIDRAKCADPIDAEFADLDRRLNRGAN